MYEMENEARRKNGRPGARWMDRVKKAYNAIPLELRDAKVKYIEESSEVSFRTAQMTELMHQL